MLRSLAVGTPISGGQVLTSECARALHVVRALLGNFVFRTAVVPQDGISGCERGNAILLLHGTNLLAMIRLDSL